MYLSIFVVYPKQPEHIFMIPFDRRDLRASHDASSYMSFEQSVASRYVAMRSEFNLIADTFEWVGFGVHLCDGVIWRVFR